MGHCGSLWGTMDLSGALWDAMGALWGTVGLSGVLWGSMECYGSLWISVGCCGVQACGPMAQRMCGENAEVPGLCFLDGSLVTTPRGMGHVGGSGGAEGLCGVEKTQHRRLWVLWGQDGAQKS